MAMNPRLLRPRASGFSPKSIAGLTLWLDAQDSSTITLNGSTISEWRDKSASSIKFSQGTAASQPKLSTAFPNGKTVVLFEGGKLLNADAGFGVVGDTSNNIVTMLFTIACNVNPGGVFLSEAGGGTKLFWNYNSPATMPGDCYWDSAGTNGRIQGSVGTTAIETGVIATVVRNGNSRSVAYDSTLIASNNAAIAAPAGLANTGGNLRFGNSGLGSNDRCGAVLAYNRTLSATELAAVKKYLASLTGLPS